MAQRHPSDHEHDIDLDAALEFLNTIELESGQLVDHLERPADAAGWFLEHRLVHPAAAARWTDADLTQVRDARDALRDVVDAVVEGRRPDPTSVDLVNETLEARRPVRLELDGTACRIGHRHADAPVADALAIVAEAIVTELATGRPDRFRVCANDRCRWAFYDASPTGRRRWCDMTTCGNQAKAARHRARVKSQAASAPARTPSTPDVSPEATLS
jgi:predicted RNA-binding Zn ribbon-like protein